MPKAIPPRSKVDKKFTWNAESVFRTPEAWEEEVEKIVADIPLVKKFQGRLGDGPATLLEAFKTYESLLARMFVANMYASFSNAVDTADQKAAGMRDKSGGVFGQVASALSFFQPELLDIGKARLDQFIQAEEKLSAYKYYIENLFRKQAHVRSAEVEEVLGMVSDPLGGFNNSTGMLTNADFKFRSIKDAAGNVLEVTQGNYDGTLMGHPDRKVRKAAYAAYMDKHVEFKNTLATNLTHNIKTNVFNMRVRKHETTLDASLFDLNIPTSVYHNLINTYKKNLPVWQRYFEIRRKALGLKKFSYFDMWAPIEKKNVKIPYEKAVDLICAGLAPLGREYTDTVRRACTTERWVDVYPNQGKTQGAFSTGAPGTHPFILMSYNDQMVSMSTLVHELGHSMHTYFSNKNQTVINMDYSLFAAEVASNFNQAMLRAHLLKTEKDKNFQTALILEAVGSNMFRYFFQMPTLARFELEAHERVERGEPLTADSLIDLMADLFAEGFGPNFEMDRERVGMTWATFPHLFADYYVYSYATGISGAHALSNRILRGEPNAVEDYLGFLKSGGSDYPLNVLKKAGVDLTTPQAVEETFAVMEGYIDRLEELLK
jgi:oligoendopeptidase F